MEITLTQLSEETGYSVPNLCQMIRRGHLPAGRKDGKVRFLPAAECRIILATQRKAKAPWKPRKKKNQVVQISKAWRDAI